MPKINMQDYEAAEVKGGGDYQRMPAGGYVITITDVRTDGPAGNGGRVDYVDARNYVKLIYDIAEGEFAGKYSDDFWKGEAKDYGHQIYLSWKNMGAFKGNIQALDASNPGFDALAAFEADRWQLFVGKKLGIVLGEEEYEANDGSIKTRFTFPRIMSVDKIREGKYKVPPLKKLEPDQGYHAGYSTGGGNAASVYDDDIPFA